MTKQPDDAAAAAQAGFDNTMKIWGDWSKGWQAITAEMTDYTKRSFEDGTQTLEKLMAARTVEQAIDIQSKYARRCYDEYMQQMSRLGTMYVDLAKGASRPMERFMSSQRGQ
ncbi:MAG: phasin family protein [Hyphomicrobiaceae bacterium]